MTKGKTHLSRYKNVYQILDLAIWIQSRIQGATLKEISQKLEVSHRTAERMRDCLLDIFHPAFDELETIEKQKRWGFKSFVPSLANFTSSDIACLELAKKKFSNKDKAKELEAIINKIKALNKPNLRKIEADLELLIEAEGLVIKQHPKDNIDSNALNSIREALLAQKYLSFDYEIDNKQRRPKVAPYGIFYKDRGYLLAYNEYANNYRVYRLSKIKNIKIIDEYFDKNETFSLEDYINRSFGVYYDETHDVVLKFSKNIKDDVLNYHFHPSQKFEVKDDDTVIVSFQAGGLREMCWELFKWGNTVKVTAPKKLKQKYSEMLDEAKNSLA